MGHYLHIGLCYKVRVRRKLLSDQKITETELLQGMTSLLDFTLYERLDTENELIFVLSHEELKQNLSMFLAKQIQFFKQSKFKREHALRTLDAIDKCATAAEIIELANTRDLLNLQSLDLADSLNIGIWNNYLEIHITLLTFESVGKVFMEEYKDFLIYLVNLIRSASKGNPLAGAVYATIC